MTNDTTLQQYLPFLAEARDNGEPNVSSPKWDEGFASRLAREGVPLRYSAVVSFLAHMRAQDPTAAGFLHPPATPEKVFQEKAKEGHTKSLALSEMTPEQRLNFHYTGDRPARPNQLPPQLKGKSARERLEIINEENERKRERERKKK